MRLHLRVSEDGYSLDIPAALACDLAFEAGREVEVHADGRRLIVEPLRESFDELIARISDSNRHEEIDFGPPVGREAL